MRIAIILFFGLAIYPSAAYAYVDPGLVSMVLQGFFATVAGLAAAYVLGPWQWIKSFFVKTPGPEDAQSKAPPAGPGEGQSES